jgi:transposase-like protein
VIDELQQWQSRPLEAIYAIIYLDALYVKMRHEGRVENRAVYVRGGYRHGWIEGRAGVVDRGQGRFKGLVDVYD